MCSRQEKKEEQEATFIESLKKPVRANKTLLASGHDHNHQWGNHALVLGMSLALLFIPQQQRLLNIAPEHANVLLALNNSALYLGIAGGAAVGGLALHFFAITQLAWVGTIAFLQSYS